MSSSTIFLTDNLSTYTSDYEILHQQRSTSSGNLSSPNIDMCSDTTKSTEDANKSTPPDEFLDFPKLPPELRIKIWVSAFPVSRIVKISLVSMNDSPNVKRNLAQFACTTPLPITSQVSHEARQETFKYYRVAFAIPGRRESRPVYIDFTRDIICFGDQPTINAFKGIFYHHSFHFRATDLLNHWFRGFLYWTTAPGLIQSLCCSHAEFIGLLSCPSFRINFRSLKEVFVDLEVALDVAPTAQYTDIFTLSVILEDDHRKKMGELRRPVWTDQKEYEGPDHSVMTVLIEEAVAALNSLSQEDPEWKVPTLRFGLLSSGCQIRG